MLLLVGVLLVLASVPLSGGDLRRLATVPFRWNGLLPLAVVLQVLFLGVFPQLPRPVTAGVHLLTYVLAAAFVWGNRRRAGLPLLALGALSNGVTIALNGGTLPASAQALETAGRTAETDGFTNSGVLADPVLPWLGDVFAVPASVPFANVFSVGDVVILLGAAWFVVGTCHRRARAVVPEQDVLLTLTVEELRAEVELARAALRTAQRRNAELTRQLTGRPTHKRKHRRPSIAVVPAQGRRAEAVRNR